MRALLELHKIDVTNRFGDGPVWRMRVIREVGKVLGFDSDFLLQHSFRRNIYVTPLAENYIEFLTGKDSKLKYYGNLMEDLAAFWRSRWLHKRQQNAEVLESVKACKAEDFDVLGSLRPLKYQSKHLPPVNDHAKRLEKLAPRALN